MLKRLWSLSDLPDTGVKATAIRHDQAVLLIKEQMRCEINYIHDTTWIWEVEFIYVEMIMKSDLPSTGVSNPNLQRSDDTYHEAANEIRDQVGTWITLTPNIDGSRPIAASVLISH